MYRDRRIMVSASEFNWTSNPRLLDGVQLHDAAPLILMGLDRMWILGRGSVRSEQINIPDVRYVHVYNEQCCTAYDPLCGYISVKWLCMHYGFMVTFMGTSCCISDEATGKMFGRGHLCRDFSYVVDSLDINIQQPEQQKGQEMEMEVDHTPIISSADDDQRKKDFFMDSGAAYHSTYDSSILQSYPAHLNIKSPIQSISGLSGPAITVQGCGFIDGPGGKLDFVLHIPDSIANLISVGQLTRDYPVKVVFYKQRVWIEELQNGERIGEGHRYGDGNHYVLDNFNQQRLLNYFPNESA